jgi:hypothetical protein
LICSSCENFFEELVSNCHDDTISR